MLSRWARADQGPSNEPKDLTRSSVAAAWPALRMSCLGSCQMARSPCAHAGMVLLIGSAWRDSGCYELQLLAERCGKCIPSNRLPALWKSGSEVGALPTMNQSCRVEMWMDNHQICRKIEISGHRAPEPGVISMLHCWYGMICCVRT
jgi:hypothetical protein